MAPADALPPPKEMAGDGLKLLFVGRFDRQKGLDILLSAFKRVQRTDVTLHLVGEAEYDDESRLDMSDPRVWRHGWVPHMELDGWLAAADALVVPSRWEGAPLVVLEAMRNRTAVIASSQSAMPEMLDQGAAGMLFPLDDPSQLTAIIEDLEPEALTALGEAGFARFQGNYTLDHAGAALDAAYEMALARRRERG
ncbi:MAG: glycosyltransferase family 4 protein [Alphaproteobacteria bacterium]|nr:glycosyltransferase family 4 protein [Alphaproteobacteria bacterium]